MQLLDNGYPVDVVYLDFKKAFDTVLHQWLTKLASYGILSNVYNWIEDFLSHRSQRVRVGKGWSTKADVLSGIPQGNVLGPILFTTFINDLPESVQSCCKVFVGDTKIYMTRIATVLRERKTSIEYKNSLTCGIYTLIVT